MGKQQLADIDLTAKLDRASYRKRLHGLKTQLPRVELAYKFASAQAVIVIEGWDAVGKGGVIRRLTSALDPRGYKVWPIGAPTESEKAEHYLQRFWRRLPAKGTWAVFDRSWYGRVLVERVEKFARPAEWRRAYDEINEFEKMLTDDGVRIVKLFFHMSPAEQIRRLHKRMADPLERWKMSLHDIHNVELRAEYTEAIDDMLRHNDTRYAPWRVIPFEDKRFGRIAAMEHVVKVLSKGMDLSFPPLTKDVVDAARSLDKHAFAAKRRHKAKKGAV
jgi:polyphosphate kinase 2 (PPK2 family)